MSRAFEDLCASLGMTEIIRLQSMLSLALRQRFEQKAALAFSDIVGSTRYFATFGDEAGRRLQQRHIDLLREALASGEGRVVDTAGDGAFLVFKDVATASWSFVTVMRRIAADNADREPDHRLAVRVGIHYGSVLTDGVQVTGDAVNLCSRVAASAEPGEVRLTRDAFDACVETWYRCRCRVVETVALKGFESPVELLSLRWRDEAIFPSRVRLDTGEECELPDRDVVNFGRYQPESGGPANEITLRCADPALTKAISRWHFQLIRRADGLLLRSLSDAPTEVNDRLLKKGEEVRVCPGDAIRVGRVLTLWLEGPEAVSEPTIEAGDEVLARLGRLPLK